MPNNSNSGAQVTSAQTFIGNRGAGAMRPFLGKDGKPYIMVHTGGKRNDPKNYKQQPVTNAVLRYDEWRSIDDAVTKIAEERLVGFADLRANGLVHTLNNAMGTTVLTWEDMSNAMEAVISIDPIRKGDNDQVDFSANHIPIPVTHADFQISERILQESRNRGDSLDTLNSERAARKVAEKLEDMLFGSTSALEYGGGTIYTYITHPDNNDVSLTTNWDASAITPALILADVIAMKQASIDAMYYGPWVLYIPTSYDTVMDEDYDVSGSSLQTIRQRITAINGIQKVEVVDRLAADNVLLVTMQKDVVDLVDGMPMQNVQWDNEGGFVHKYKVLTIQVPRVKSDYDGNSGVVLLS